MLGPILAQTDTAKTSNLFIRLSSPDKKNSLIITDQLVVVGQLNISFQPYINSSFQGENTFFGFLESKNIFI